MDGWMEVAALSKKSAVSCLCFDTRYNLFWAGDIDGFVCSYGADTHRLYSKFRVSQTGIVRQISIVANMVVSLASDGLFLHERKGRQLASLISETFTDITVSSSSKKEDNSTDPKVFDTSKLTDLVSFVSLNERKKEFLVAKKLFYFYKINFSDCTIKRIRRSTNSQAGIVKIKQFGNQICAGLEDGSVQLLSSSGEKLVHQFPSIGGIISDMDCTVDRLVVCSYSFRGSSPLSSSLINVYDLKNKVLLSPVTFPSGVSFVRFHQKVNYYCVALSTAGQFQLINLKTNQQVIIQHGNPNVNYTCLELWGDFLLMGGDTAENNNVGIGPGSNKDCGGAIILYRIPDSNTRSHGFVEHPQPLPVPLFEPNPVAQIDVDDETVPFSTVGMPYYGKELLSSWTGSRPFKVGLPPLKIDESLLREMGANGDHENNHGAIFSRRPSVVTTPRNLAITTDASFQKLVTPKFISEQQKWGRKENEDGEHDDSQFNDALSETRIKNMYKKLDIKYSRFGVHDFDFDYYNKTSYSGLEPHICNAYLNPLVQLFKFSNAFHNYSLHAVANFDERNSISETPILTFELGWLFDMLDKANGSHCRAANFTQAFETIVRTHGEDLFLIYEEGLTDRRNDLSQLLQGAIGFILRHLDVESRHLGMLERYDDLFQLNSVSAVSSHLCGFTSTSSVKGTHINLSFLPSGIGSSLQFGQEKAVGRSEFCPVCKRTHMMSMRSILTSLPEILMINVVQTSHKLRSGGYDHFFVSSRGQGLYFSDKGGDSRYDILGMVFEISSYNQSDNHLIAVVKDKEGDWYLFNDFLVRKLSYEEATATFSWKRPVVVMYQRAPPPPVDEDWKQHLDLTVLYKDYFAAGTRNGIKREYELLTKEAAPTPGTHVAMDAEFVVLRHEEMDFRSDGRNRLVRPKVLSLARVSVVRGDRDDALYKVPFIDDYVLTLDPIEDYLTEFSGIEPGDLNPETTNKGLVTKQTSYRKLWLLLNLGCIFIGHGLHNDFRTINIKVPPSQVIDTLDIYYLAARQRKLSLKFVAWYILDEAVQTGNHDSVEDAQTALLLYQRYLKLQKEGIFETVLQNMYNDGKRWNFRAQNVPRNELLP